jgi:hypothetical protein
MNVSCWRVAQAMEKIKPSNGMKVEGQRISYISREKKSL